MRITGRPFGAGGVAGAGGACRASALEPVNRPAPAARVPADIVRSASRRCIDTSPAFGGGMLRAMTGGVKAHVRVVNLRQASYQPVLESGGRFGYFRSPARSSASG